MQMDRRAFLRQATAVTAGMMMSPGALIGQESDDGKGDASRNTMKTRTIPGTDEEVPVVGVGTWQQFDVAAGSTKLKHLRNVLNTLFRTGGSVIDSSPMYGRSESVVGRLLSEMGARDRSFLATKVWTRGRSDGIRQMKRSMERMNTDTIDLMQVHNLVDWRTHLPVLQSWKEEGRVRYHGVTHYTRGSFDDLAEVMRNEDIDFVQLPLSIGVRGAADRLLPIAEDEDIGVVVNRPFEGGSVFSGIRGGSLPDWADEIDCSSWAQYFLKYILSHREVTCVIPGTSDPQHMLDNARAGMGRIPDQADRRRMVAYWENL